MILCFDLAACSLSPGGDEPFPHSTPLGPPLGLAMRTARLLIHPEQDAGRVLRKIFHDGSLFDTKYVGYPDLAHLYLFIK